MKPTRPLRHISLVLLSIGFVNAYTQSISGVVNSYYQVTAINTSTNTVTVSNATGLTPYTRVLLMQMKGATIDATNSSSYGNITAINNAGNYEMNTICSVSGNSLVLEYKLLNTYTPGDTVQLVSVPSYKSVTISDTLKSTAWSMSTATGGIVAIEATDTIYLNSAINVSGQGFAGGPLFNYAKPTYDCSIFQPVTSYYFSLVGTMYQNGGEKGEGIADYIAGEECGRGKLANGGGGGDAENTGGGGGGNYGSGGLGGTSNASCPNSSRGIGGLSLSTYGYSTTNNRIFFGGGGGSGHENNAYGLPGGNGGGIVLLSAPVIVANGTSILANGGRPYNAALGDPFQAGGDGAGGGGAGGTVILNGNISGTVNISANGAAGGNASYQYDASLSCMGPGGGGGGGTIWVAGSSFPSSITASVSGGANGVIASNNADGCAGASNSATSGTNGIAQANYVLPASSTKVCTLLAIPGLQYFSGTLIGNGAQLNWQMNVVDNLDHYEIEYSVDHVTYTSIATISNDGAFKLSYSDTRTIEGTIYYRLKVVQKDGSLYYSEIVVLTKNTNTSVQFISLRPNPAINQIITVLYARKMSQAALTIYNSYGQKMMSSWQQLSEGYNKIPIQLSALSSGVYYLKIAGEGFVCVKSFIKQ